MLKKNAVLAKSVLKNDGDVVLHNITKSLAPLGKLFLFKYFLITVKQSKKFLTQLFQTSQFVFWIQALFHFAHRNKYISQKPKATRVRIISTSFMYPFFIENSLLSLAVAVFSKYHIHLLSNPSQFLFGNFSSSSRFDLRLSGMDPDFQFTAQIFRGISQEFVQVVLYQEQLVFWVNVILEGRAIV